jgi:hypothetical protein
VIEAVAATRENVTGICGEGDGETCPESVATSGLSLDYRTCGTGARRFARL